MSLSNQVGGGGGKDQSPRVLSIQSHVVSGYVGNKCASFPLQVLGFEVDSINSVQFSNHTGYGQWKGQVLTDADLKELYEGMMSNKLVDHTHLLTGYVGSDSFLRQIRDVVTRVKDNNPNSIYLCDPVLGDNGHFYVPQSLIPIYREEILPLADITTPNTFELELLSETKVNSETDALVAMDKLHDLGVKIVVLSSLDAPGSDELATYASFKNGSERKVWKLVSTRLEGIFTGTGDLFAALFLGWYHKLGKDNLPRVLETALATMQVVLKRTKVKGDERRLAEGHPPGGKPRPQELQLIQSLDVILNPGETRQAVPVPLA